MTDYILLCARGCGQLGSDVEAYQDPDSLKDGDKTLYCKGCNGDLWYAIPEGDE